jgi:hypothetical protein
MFKTICIVALGFFFLSLISKLRNRRMTLIDWKINKKNDLTKYGSEKYLRLAFFQEDNERKIHDR